MKADIIVERFDNGITIKWSNDGVEVESIVAPDGETEKTIGKMLLEDIDNLMDMKLTNIVKIHIEYEDA